MPLKPSVTYLSNGNYLIQTGDSDSSALEVSVADLGNQIFKIEVDGLTMKVSVAVYSNDKTEHVHIWHGAQHHHFRRRLVLELFDDDDSQQKPSFEKASLPAGTVVAPMAGLLVKVLLKDGTRVEEGQPVLVLEVMKMEVCPY